VERSRPIENAVCWLCSQCPSNDPFDSPSHFSGGTAGECHQEEAARVGTVDDQMTDAVR